MLDGAALGFGRLFGSGSVQLVRVRRVGGGVIYLSICSGEAPCFKVICPE